MQAIGEGTVLVEFYRGSATASSTGLLHNVLHVPELHGNILSPQALSAAGYGVSGFGTMEMIANTRLPHAVVAVGQIVNADVHVMYLKVNTSSRE